jgi:hypothetical protein
MSTFFYRCPNTGFKVKDWVADDPTKDEAFAPDDLHRVCASAFSQSKKPAKLLGRRNRSAAFELIVNLKAAHAATKPPTCGLETDELHV